MKKVFMLAGIMAALIFSSCKKDKDAGPDDNGGGGTKMLKKVTKTEEGVTTVYNLIYDGNKKLISFSSTDNLQTTGFTYDGAGNVTKVEVRQQNYYSTYTYTYNNGIPVSGTIKSILKVAGEPDDLQQDDVLTYTVVNNQVTRIHQKTNMEDGEEVDIDLTYHPSGNLAKAEAVGDVPVTITYTYGTKKPAFPALSKWVLDLGFSLEFAAKNELITLFMDFPGPVGDVTVTNQYTYDAGGYPLTSNDGEVQIKYEYQ